MSASRGEVLEISDVATNAWKRRQDSFDAFEQFRTSFGKEFFEQFRDLEANTLEGWYIAWHQLCICPGGANGGEDLALFEVFFGFRPHPVPGKDGSSPSRQNDHIIERGAMLRYAIQVDGSVVVQLFPAHTKEIRQLYDWMILDSSPSAKHLMKPRMLRGHWKALMSCMASTSISGAFRRRDRWRMTWLRIWRHRYEGERLQDPPGPIYVGKSILWVISWFFGVALSGLAVAWYLTKQDTVTPAVQNSASITKDGLQTLHADVEGLRAEIKRLTPTTAENTPVAPAGGSARPARPRAGRQNPNEAKQKSASINTTKETKQ